MKSLWTLLAIVLVALTPSQAFAGKKMMKVFTCVNTKTGEVVDPYTKKSVPKVTIPTAPVAKVTVPAFKPVAVPKITAAPRYGQR